MSVKKRLRLSASFQKRRVFGGFVNPLSMMALISVANERRWESYYSGLQSFEGVAIQNGRRIPHYLCEFVDKKSIQTPTMERAITVTYWTHNQH
jgi:hypothetical protein